MSLKVIYKCKGVNWITNKNGAIYNSKIKEIVLWDLQIYCRILKILI